jgi:hypothetical protein
MKVSNERTKVCPYKEVQTTIYSDGKESVQEIFLTEREFALKFIGEYRESDEYVKFLDTKGKRIVFRLEKLEKPKEIKYFGVSL